MAGLGRLGGAMVNPARVFGMDVIAWSENLKQERADELGVARVSKSDLSQMKRSAVLINTSRGPIVDERALAAALRDGTIAGAGLDVFDHEPVPAGHELLELENTALLPHLGYVSEDAFRAMYGEAVQDVAAFLRGEPIRVLS